MQSKLTELLTIFRHKIPQIFGTVFLSLFLLFPAHLKAQDDQSQNYDPSIVKNGENLFEDERGVISNHELTEPINLIGMIDSKKGT